MRIATLVMGIGERYGAVNDAAARRIVAAILGLTERAILRWCTTDDLRTAQTQHVVTLVAAAKAAGIKVTVDDLVIPQLDFLLHLQGRRVAA